MSSPVSESKRISDKLESIRKQTISGVTLSQSHATGKPATNLDNHPAKYFEEDPRDEYYETKKLITKQAGAGLGTTVPVTERDIQYLIDQKTKTEKYDFDRWKYKTYSPGADPTRIKYFESIDPGFFKAREEQIDQDLDLIEKLALLSLFGVQNEDDVMILYAINKGKLSIPNWKQHFPWSNPEDLTATNPISQGYWNPRKYGNDDGKIYVPSIWDSRGPLKVTRPYYSGGTITFDKDPLSEFFKKFNQ